MAGHRRWILYPPTSTIGIGDIPTPADGYRPANATYVFGGRRHVRPDVPFVAWPAPGYLPYQLMPAGWSFAVGPDTRFGAATVAVTANGQPLPVQVVSTGGPSFGLINERPSR